MITPSRLGNRLCSISKSYNGSSISDRMRIFLKLLKVLGYLNYTQPPEHVHVSCTGYVSPSTKLCKKKLGEITKSHMGCYAALPIRM